MRNPFRYRYQFVYSYRVSLGNKSFTPLPGGKKFRSKSKANSYYLDMREILEGEYHHCYIQELK